MTTGAETLYSFRTAFPDVLQCDREQDVSCPVYRDGALVEPSAATFKLLAPDGTVIVDDDATIIGGIATFTLTTTHTDSDTYPKGEGYQEVWQFTIEGGQVGPIDREAALAPRPLYPVITDSDLTEEHPDLANHLGSSITSFQRWIDAAWKRIVGRLIQEGHLPYVVKSAWAFREPHMELTRGLFLRWLHQKAPRGNFGEAAAEAMEAYERSWNAISFRVDADHDTRVDDLEQRLGTGGGIVHRNHAPHGRRLRRDPRW